MTNLFISRQNCESDDNSQRVRLKDSHLIDTNIENPTKTNETVSDKYKQKSRLYPLMNEN